MFGQNPKTVFKKFGGASRRRWRKCLKGNQDPVDYADKVERLFALYDLAKQGFIELFFGDESGFSLTLNVPYVWPFPGEPIRILPQRSRRINGLGFMNAAGAERHTFSSEGSVKADFVIESINQWRTRLTKPTVLVLDTRTGEPALIHRSAALQACLAEWEGQDLYIFFLPTYNAHAEQKQTASRFTDTLAPTSKL